MIPKNITNKALALILAVMTIILAGVIPAHAEYKSISNGNSTSVTIEMGTRYTYLESTDGTAFGGEAWTYTTNDGISGGAYCINWGLKAAPSNKELPISGLYTSKPATIGAFASGYPQRSLDDFLKIYLADNPQLAGLTEAEFGYATQIAVWSTLGQIAVQGTAFTEGRKTLAIPYSDPQQIRTFRALEIILDNASYWDRPLKHSLEIRNEKDVKEYGIDIQTNNSLEDAMIRNAHGIKRETINGKEYYTRLFTSASGTSTWKHGYNIELRADNAPEGTIFVDESNIPLNTVVWEGQALYQLPTVIHETYLNANGSEYWGTFKIAIPVQMTPEDGNITIHATSTANQYNIYFANNTDYSEQSYVIADPLYASVNAQTTFKWITSKSIFGTIIVHKIDDMGKPLEGALFHLEGSDGSVLTGTSDATGLVKWDLLNPALKYFVREMQAPPGYRIADPVNVSVIANETVNLTIKNESDRYFRMRKIDAQNGYPLGQAVFHFEQVDGGYSTDAVTGHDGYIQFKGGELPFGSYKVYEVQAPTGYQKDASVQTVNWNGRQDVMLTFKNVRTLSLVLIKSDFDTKATLEGAVFKLYKDGNFITTATTNSAGEIRFTNLEPGYYEVEEQQAPAGYILDSRRHGINIDPYNTATTADPLLVVTNKAKGALKIRKVDSTDSKKGLDGVVLRIQNASLGIDRQYTTANGGYITVSGLEPDNYIITEVASIPGYELSKETVVVSVRYGETTHAIFKNEPHGKITIIKVDSITGKHLPGANIKLTDIDGKAWDVITGADGTSTISDLPQGQYTVQELNAPLHYELNSVPQSVIVKPSETSFVKIQNNPFGTMVITKIDVKTGLPMVGVKIRIYNDTLNYDKTETTDSKGQIHLIDLYPTDYTITEVATIPGYQLSTEVLTKTVAYGQETTVTFKNQPKGSVTVIKVDSVTGEHLQGANIKMTDPVTGQTWDLVTGSDGTATVTDLSEGEYYVQEQNQPLHYEINDQVFPVTVVSGENSSVKIQNNPLGKIEITKVSSLDATKTLAGVKLRVQNTLLGYDKTYTTDKDGKILIEDLTPGDYTISEVATIPGYKLSTETVVATVNYGKTTPVIFKNEPLPHIAILKIDSQTNKPIEGAVFRVTNRNTQQNYNVTTDADGKIYIPNVIVGWYDIVEVTPPTHYVPDYTVYSVYADVGKPGEITIKNTKMPSLTVIKVDKDTQKVLSGGIFSIEKIGEPNSGTITGSPFTTDNSGKIFIPELMPGSYKITEIQAPFGYNISENNSQIITMVAGQDNTVKFENTRQPSFILTKTDSRTGKTIEGAAFKVEKLDNPGKGAITGTPLYTDENGQIIIPNLLSGMYRVTEVEPANGYGLPSPNVWEINIIANEDYNLKVKNTRLPSLVINKIDGWSYKGIPNTYFEVFYAVNGSFYGEVRSLGTFKTDKDGQIVIPNCQPGLYRYTEIRPAPGYSKPSNPTKDVFLALGDNAYSGVGGDAWIAANFAAVNGTMAISATPMTEQATASPTPAQSQSDTPTQGNTETEKETPSQNTTPVSPTPSPSVPSTAEPSPTPPTTSGSGLTPTKPNIDVLIPSKSNSEQ